MSHPPQNNPERILTPGFVRIVTVQVAFGISYSAFLLLPKYLRTVLNASAAEIGLMAGICLVGAAVLSPVVGALAGRFDRRWLLGAALVLEGGAAVLFTQVTEIGPFAYTLRLLQGVAFVILFNCTATLVADHVPQGRLGQSVGYLGLSMICTNALAPALTEPLAAKYGWSIAFGVPGACALLAVFVLPRLDGSRENPSGEKPIGRGPPGLGAVYYGSLLMGAGIGTLFTFVQPYVLSLGAKNVGSFFFGYVAAAILARGVFGWVPDRLGPHRVAGASMLLYAVTTVGAAGVTPATLPLLGFFLGISHGFIYPALSARGFSLTAKGSRSQFMGWFAFSFNTGFAVAVLALGPLADRYGFAPIFIGSGIWIATGVLPLFFERKPRPVVAVL